MSIGAGNCETEVLTAQLLREAGLTDFAIECLELSPEMLKRGRELAISSGVESNLVFVQGDFNRWKADKQYAGIIANQSLHHVLELEHLFTEIKRGLHPDGFFVVSDMIGRNGHQRWPEALQELKPFWHELPIEYRWNQQLKRCEEEYSNFDCSAEGFEGIRSQDVLPLLGFVGLLDAPSHDCASESEKQQATCDPGDTAMSVAPAPALRFRSLRQVFVRRVLLSNSLMVVVCR